MYHSVTFGNNNSWDRWKLIPTARPIFAQPSVLSSPVSSPLMDGTIEGSDKNGDRVYYGNRQGAFQFLVSDQERPWIQIYTELLNELHGKEMRVILEDDPSYFYFGRITLEDWSTGADYSTVTIGYDVGPFKQSINGEQEGG